MVHDHSTMMSTCTLSQYFMSLVYSRCLVNIQRADTGTKSSLADDFLGQDLAVSWLQCLGSQSAKDPGYREGSEYGTEWDSVWPYTMVVSVPGVGLSHVSTGEALLSSKCRVHTLWRSVACEPCSAGWVSAIDPPPPCHLASTSSGWRVHLSVLVCM